MTDKIQAWHFIQNDRKLRYSKSQKLVHTGQVLHVNPDKLELCKFGLHASRRAIDALKYAPGNIVCKVELSGRILEGNDKLCAERRKVLWMADATEVLHEFACQAAEAALAQIPKEDISPSSLAAIAAKRKWLKREINNDELTKVYNEALRSVDEMYGKYYATLAARRGRRADASRAALWAGTVAFDAAYVDATRVAATIAHNFQYHFKIDLNDKLEEMLNTLHW